MNARALHDRIGWVLACLFTLGCVLWFVTGFGGPMRLAVTLVPLALTLLLVDESQRGSLPAPAAWMLGAAVAGAAVHIGLDFEAIRVERVGTWNMPDLGAAGILLLAAMTLAYHRWFPLFVLNLALIVYAVAGPLVPGVFGHAGIPVGRVLTVTTLEMSTGMFDRLAQLGLTLIAAFILVLAVLRAFGCVDAILAASARFAIRRPQALPQAAVAGSFAIAAVSGSGAANAATTGSATIPALVRSGFSPTQAAAVETASSLGGQLMPPLMGVAAFMMAEVMGVGYFEVAARGLLPALIYFAGISFAVYLLSAGTRPASPSLGAPQLARGDTIVGLCAYLVAVAGLLLLMGAANWAPMEAAVRVAAILIVVLGARAVWQGRDLPVARIIKGFAGITAELVVLLAVLGVLTGIFTVTGVPTKVGALLVEAYLSHPLLLVLVAAAFGIVVGMGLPAAPTYIILAVVVAPVMIRAGFDPWTVHFFAFFIAVFGELTPPTSVTAAVAARIAEAPFIATMFAALRLCIPLLVLTIAVFLRPGLVTAAGGPQFFDGVLVLVATLGAAFALSGNHRMLGARITAAIGAGATLYLAPMYATVAALFTIAATLTGLRMERQSRGAL